MFQSGMTMEGVNLSELFEIYRKLVQKEYQQETEKDY